MQHWTTALCFLLMKQQSSKTFIWSCILSSDDQFNPNTHSSPASFHPPSPPVGDIWIVSDSLLHFVPPDGCWLCLTFWALHEACSQETLLTRLMKAKSRETKQWSYFPEQVGKAQMHKYPASVLLWGPLTWMWSFYPLFTYYWSSFSHTL